MDMIYVGWGVEPEGDAALIGNDEDAQAGLIQLCDGFGNSWEQVKVLPGCDVLSLRHFAVENAIAVQEDGSQIWME